MQEIEKVKYVGEGDKKKKSSREKFFVFFSSREAVKCYQHFTPLSQKPNRFQPHFFPTEQYVNRNEVTAYKHWREIDPRGIILSKIFNICIKIKKIPPSWKQSSCVLIPKKGDLSITENWRPISLSSTIYKLFTKCLTRTLQEWCETHGVISNCQKGFTPFDGVVEHNFVIGQHMELARRSHSDIFLIWLDISNAFGSIPHEVLFRALSNHGIDPDFVDIIRDIYNNSFTQILSNEGPTEPIPLLCGVKQGCPLSGLLFNLSINHILFNLQKNHASHS
ncbi:transposon TX1 uncharacterized 149 kDa protein, partial [Nephila pilipes]